MKRMIAIVLAALTIAASLTGCGGRGNVSTTPDGTVNGYQDNNDSSKNDTQYGNDYADSYADTRKPEHPMQEFGDDLEDAADDVMDGVEDFMDRDDDRSGSGRHGTFDPDRRTGTGMAGEQ